MAKLLTITSGEEPKDYTTMIGDRKYLSLFHDSKVIGDFWSFTVTHPFPMTSEVKLSPYNLKYLGVLNALHLVLEN